MSVLLNANLLSLPVPGILATCHLQHCFTSLGCAQGPSQSAYVPAQLMHSFQLHAIGCYLPQILMNVLAVPENSPME